MFNMSNLEPHSGDGNTHCCIRCFVFQQIFQLSCKKGDLQHFTSIIIVRVWAVKNFRRISNNSSRSFFMLPSQFLPRNSFGQIQK